MLTNDLRKITYLRGKGSKWVIKPLNCLNVCLTLLKLSLHTSGWSAVHVQNHLQVADGFVLLVISEMVIELLGKMLVKMNTIGKHSLSHDA